MIRRLALAGIAAASLAGAAHAQPAPDPMTADFITKAAQSDEFERREGRLAEQHAHNPHVRQFAREMVAAHTQTTIGLKAAVHRAGMTAPPMPPLSDAQGQMIAALRGAHGGDFDRTYMDQQVQAHQEALGGMQGYAQSGHPGPIRDAAQKTAPLVQHHLDMAKALQGHMGG